MPEIRFPARLPLKQPKQNKRRTCAGHRAWVRKHRCSVPGCLSGPIDCAHVRRGTDGATGVKPSDQWCISLCRHHHQEQHEIGETAFEEKYDVHFKDLATEFAKRSPFLKASLAERNGF